jgi:curved DNA-binding protein CbpA
LKNYYELLELAPTASQEDIKRAFRLQIARYHPDKVHHLGKEFQEMAAERAAELTEAYRILSDQMRRAEYDRTRDAAAPATAQVAPPQAGPSSAPVPVEAPRPATPTADANDTAAQQAAAGHAAGWFKQERATRDEFVRRATIGRFRQALEQAVGDSYDNSQVRGFDLAYAPRTRLFGRSRRPWLLVQVVSLVDARAISDSWVQAGQGGVRSGDETCVFLMGSGMAPRGELERAIATQRRRAGKDARVTLVPIDVRDWDAHIPVDAPTVVRDLLARLRSGG